MYHQKRPRFYLAILSFMVLCLSLGIAGCGSGSGSSGGSNSGGNSGNGGSSTETGNYAWVANNADNTLGMIDLDTYTYKELELADGRAISVGVGPYDVAVRPDNQVALVTNRGDGTVSAINVLNEIVVSSYTGFNTPTQAVYNPNAAFAAITSYGDGYVYFISSLGGSVRVTIGGNPFGVAVSPDNLRAYVSNQADRSISVIDLTQVDYPITNTIANTGGASIDVDASGNYVYVADTINNQLVRINTSDYTNIQRIDVGTSPMGLECSPTDTNLVYVVNSGSNNVSVVSSGVLQTNITVGTTPMFCAFTSDGTRLFVTNSGSNSVSVINVSTNTVVATVGTGNTPMGIATKP